MSLTYSCVKPIFGEVYYGILYSCIAHGFPEASQLLMLVEEKRSLADQKHRESIQTHEMNSCFLNQFSSIRHLPDDPTIGPPRNRSTYTYTGSFAKNTGSRRRRLRRDVAATRRKRNQKARGNANCVGHYCTNEQLRTSVFHFLKQFEISNTATLDRGPTSLQNPGPQGPRTEGRGPSRTEALSPTHVEEMLMLIMSNGLAESELCFLIS
jgi:hypothetical protein